MRESFSVEEYMSRNVVTFTPEMDVMDAIRLLVDRRISGAPVINNLGELEGMLSERDCMKVAIEAGYHQQCGGRVGEFMHPKVESVTAEESIFDVAKRFAESKYRRYPVTKDNRLVGQISRRDVLRAMVEHC